MIKKIMFGILIFVLFSYSVSAFGVAAPYAANEPVFVPIGETKDLNFLIQNGAGATEDVTAKIEILEGNEIIEIVGQDEYLVPAKGEINSILRVNIPKNAQLGDKWHVKLSFKATPKTKSGAVSIGQGVITSFDVVTAQSAVEIPTGGVIKEINFSNAKIAIAVIIIVTIIFFLVRRKKVVKKKK